MEYSGATLAIQRGFKRLTRRFAVIVFTACIRPLQGLKAALDGNRTLSDGQLNKSGTMAGRHPALVALVLLAATLSGPTAASGKSDIVGAVTKQAAKLRGAAKISIGGGKSAEPQAGGSTLGVKGPQKQHHYSKKCGTQAPTHKDMEAVQSLLNAAGKFAADEDAARAGAALLYMHTPVCWQLHGITCCYCIRYLQDVKQ